MYDDHPIHAMITLAQCEPEWEESLIEYFCSLDITREEMSLLLSREEKLYLLELTW